MRKQISTVLLLATVSCASTSSDAEDIRAHLDAWEAAWNRGDAEAIADLYTPDADRTFAHGTVTKGRDAIREMYAGSIGSALPDGVERSLSLHVLSVRPVAEDVAVVDYEYRATGISVAPHLKVNGRSTVVLTRQDGRWLRAAQRNWIPARLGCLAECHPENLEIPHLPEPGE